MQLFDIINNRIDTICKIKQQKEAIKNGLKIEWETDPAKMEFCKLRSYQPMKVMFDAEVLRVEEYKIHESEYPDIFIGDIQSHMEMIDILMTGGKLIPPSRTEGYAIVDGIETFVRPAVGLNDGSHRLNLAKYFGLDIVPVVVFKSFEGYWFTPEKWRFEGPRIRVEQQINGGTSYNEYGGLKVTSKDGKGKVFTFKDGSAYIDDSNTEYLVILTR